MTEILSLRGILDICARQNGKSISIIEECVDHLLIGNGVLVVITFNGACVRTITEEICNNLEFRKLQHKVHHRSIGNISSEYDSYVKIFEFDRLLNGDVFCGMTINDILFDCPELLFDRRIFELMSRLQR